MLNLESVVKRAKQYSEKVGTQLSFVEMIVLDYLRKKKKRSELAKKKKMAVKKQKAAPPVPTPRTVVHLSPTSTPREKSVRVRTPREAVKSWSDVPRTMGSLNSSWIRSPPSPVKKKKKKTIEPKPDQLWLKGTRIEDKSSDSQQILEKNASKKNVSDVVLEEIDGNEQENISDDLFVRKNFAMQIGKCIGISLAGDIRELLFGHRKGLFLDSWTRQGFHFNKIEALKYGLVQNEGGCCGVIAPVQGYILKFLLTKYQKSKYTSEDLNNALVDALSSILWKAGDRSCLCVRGRLTNGGKNVEKAFKDFSVYKLDSIEAVQEFFKSNLELYMQSHGLGVILFLLSVILTRGISNIYSDMDHESSLIAQHGYCTQELVNLLITGKATSNCFDGVKELGDENEKQILKGIQSRSEIGFLSHLEKKNYLVVGENLKNPLYPIWIIYHESHYTVLFAKKKIDDTKPFDLYYYDQLGGQENEIRLTVRKTNTRKAEDTEIPLDECIQTKWGNVTVDWNGSEKIL